MVELLKSTLGVTVTGGISASIESSADTLIAPEQPTNTLSHT